MVDREVKSGVLLLLFTILALIVSNSSFADSYSDLLHSHIQILFNGYGYNSSFLHFVNEGLMAVFFFHVGLEIKHAFVAGELRGRKAILFPAVAALGGMCVPALIYSFVVSDVPNGQYGWGIPVATDIAFSLGLFMLFSSSLPVVLRVFLISLATFDDIGAIAIIAAYYTSELSIYLLLATLLLSTLMLYLNVRQYAHIGSYIVLGFIHWCFMLESGVHATLSGVLAALLIPMTHDTHTRLEELTEYLYPIIYYGILPIFAFLNAGIPLFGYPMAEILSTKIAVGIWLGLLVGKPLGILVFVYVSEKLHWVSLPKGVNYTHILGIGCLCGIGFTMSLFIAALAFNDADMSYQMASRSGILLGSFLSAIAGSIVLFYSKKNPSVVVPSEH
ncbi:MAG: Na+/H+ antiporter NhaA [Legionellales bacterium]|nr:Na+/H+ antiporter NhaA [Legionellales bacterium]|tara:strand:- start:1304 stop:2470 length:1167 start_codon:yes stop_codon:yes gene_type:complete